VHVKFFEAQSAVIVSIQRTTPQMAHSFALLCFVQYAHFLGVAFHWTGKWPRDWSSRTNFGAGSLKRALFDFVDVRPISFTLSSISAVI
jgi:hypothetical protein